jgi:hypothetical protein
MVATLTLLSLHFLAYFLYINVNEYIKESNHIPGPHRVEYGTHESYPDSSDSLQLI